MCVTIKTPTDVFPTCQERQTYSHTCGAFVHVCAYNSVPFSVSILCIPFHVRDHVHVPYPFPMIKWREAQDDLWALHWTMEDAYWHNDAPWQLRTPQLQIHPRAVGDLCHLVNLVSLQVPSFAPLRQVFYFYSHPVPVHDHVCYCCCSCNLIQDDDCYGYGYDCDCCCYCSYDLIQNWRWK